MKQNYYSNLNKTLQSYFQCNKARLNYLTLIVISLIDVATVRLNRISLKIKSGVKHQSNYRNLQRLVDAYYKYLVAYATSGIPNRELIKKIGISLNVDAIIQGEIFNVIKVDGQYGYHRGQTRCQLRYSAVTTSEGKVVWETTVDAYSTTATALESAPPLMDVVMEGMNKILEGMPK